MDSPGTAFDDTPQGQLKRLVGMYSQPPAPAPAPIQSAPVVMPDAPPPITPKAPAVPSPAATRQSAADTELGRLQSTGSGVSQLQHTHPILGTVAKVGDSLLGAMFPTIAQGIPGTTAHHNALVNTQEKNVAQDQGEQQQTAQLGQSAAQTGLENAETFRQMNPVNTIGKTPEELALHDLMTGQNGAPQVNPDTGNPYTYIEAYTKVKESGQKTPQEVSLDKQYNDAIAKGDHITAARILKVKHDIAVAGQAPQQPQREPRQLAIGPDGSVIELKPGMKVAPGTKSVSADLKGATADEERRSDLSRNLNENLDQLDDILNRRPDLFGPMAGRLTAMREAVGTSDPDVARLKTIKEQLGMAVVGAHAMRNASHVETAANAIVNGFNNSPEAIKAASAVARQSVATFQKDAGDQPGSAPKGAAGGMIRARDPSGVLHEAPAGTALPKGWKQE